MTQGKPHSAIWRKVGHSYILLKTSHCSWSLDGGPSIWKYLLYLHLKTLCLQYFTVVTVWFRECSYSADVYRVFLAFTAVFCSWISGVSEHLLLGRISGALFSTCSFFGFQVLCITPCSTCSLVGFQVLCSTCSLVGFQVLFSTCSLFWISGVFGTRSSGGFQVLCGTCSSGGFQVLCSTCS